MSLVHDKGNYIHVYFKDGCYSVYPAPVDWNPSEQTKSLNRIGKR